MRPAGSLMSANDHGRQTITRNAKTNTPITRILAYSLVVHFMSATAAWCLAKAVAAPLEWGQALFLVLPVLLIATVPLSIAGWGTRETAMVLAFGYAGLPESNGLIVSVLLGIALFAAGLPGGVIWIMDRGKQIREARQTAR